MTIFYIHTHAGLSAVAAAVQGVSVIVTFIFSTVFVLVLVCIVSALRRCFRTQLEDERQYDYPEIPVRPAVAANILNQNVAYASN